MTSTKQVIVALNKRKLEELSSTISDLVISSENQYLLDEYKARYLELVNNEMSWEVIKPLLAESYLEIYTNEEIKELNEFYTSPLGKKFLSSTPLLMQKIQEQLGTVVRNLQPKLNALNENFKRELNSNMGPSGEADY